MSWEQQSVHSTRYDEFRDDSGSWIFDMADYQNDLNSLTAESISPDPDPDEAYRAAVFLEGYIRERKAESRWSDDALETFTTFSSTTEMKAVARALRVIADR